MKKYYKNKLTYNGISFLLCDNPVPDEREIHSYHEILLYIDGDAKLLSKEGQQSLKKHSIIFIPKETYHYFRLKESDKFIRLKISFSSFDKMLIPFDHTMNEIRIFENLNKNISYAFDRLYHILKQKNDKTAFYAYSAFLMLLTEMDIVGLDKSVACHSANNTLMTELMEYISMNLSKDLSIKTLSEIFHISSSSITHLFKKEYGISLHKFIVQKRLIHAKRLVQEGEPLSQIYADIGFMDYSSFYKAYTIFFGHSPSKDKNAHQM